MTHNILRPRITCCALIFLDPANQSNTYCMRELGHPDEAVKGFPGGHNIVDAPPVSDLWGAPFTSAIVNDPSFGLVVEKK
jgi:hypothetical protein